MYITVLVTTSSKEEAQKITHGLLTEKLAACVNIIENVDSHFWWLGKLDKAREALLMSEALSLCGCIYYVEEIPAAYLIGEELNPATFVVHFEKGVGGYKGLLQFVNKSFAGLLPQKYEFINREQDLGDPGLRASKEGYRPCAFVKKYRVSGP